MDRRKRVAAAVFIYMTLKKNQVKKVRKEQVKKVREKRYKKIKKPRLWVSSWIAEREQCGFLTTLLHQLRVNDPQAYHNFVPITANDFETLLNRVSPLITRKTTHMRTPISAAERLAVTLRFLAAGETYSSLSVLFRMPINTISGIVPEVCDAIYQQLKDDYLKLPNTIEEWSTISEEFAQRLNLPNCIGALGGKHIIIQTPKIAGIEYRNYKNRRSIVLIALTDSAHRFTCIEAAAGGTSFEDCGLAQALEQNSYNVPTEQPLPGRVANMPHYIVADDAFAPKPYLIKPLSSVGELSESEKVYNYRISRANRIVENVFGVAGARFRVLSRNIELHPDKVTKIALAVCVLHNLLMCSDSRSLYAPADYIDSEVNGQTISGNWRNDLDRPLTTLEVNSHTDSNVEATAVQQELQEYFVSVNG